MSAKYQQETCSASTAPQNDLAKITRDMCPVKMIVKHMLRGTVHWRVQFGEWLK